MKFSTCALLFSSAAFAQSPVVRAPDIPFKHVVVIFQENRTPDNLSQGLCAPPYGTAESCGTAPSSGQYDIKPAIGSIRRCLGEPPNRALSI
jgi:hypothetical protein